MFTRGQNPIAVILLTAWLLAGCSNSPQNRNIASPAPTITSIPKITFTQIAQFISTELAQATPATTIIPTPEPGLPSPTADLSILDTSAPTTTATPIIPPATPEGEMLFQDDFSRPSGWHTESNGNFVMEYSQDGYRIYTKILNHPTWSSRSQTYQDTILLVDILYVDGSADGYYGLICRLQNSANYYMLYVGNQGKYGIAKHFNDEMITLTEGTEPSMPTPSLSKALHLEADCASDRLTLSVNGRKLAEVKDDEFTRGSIGLVAGKQSSAGIDVLFDNFAVIRP